jgi:hypothetical protein
MPAGTSVSLSPLLAALTLSRLFGNDFANLPSRYELMLIISPTASLNHQGTSKFVDQLNTIVRSRILLVICLDSLANDSNELFVYDSPKSAKLSTRDMFIKKLKSITDVTEKGVITKSADYVSFEHSIYAEKGISAITITTADQPFTDVYQKYSLFDRDFDARKIAARIAIIAEALARTLVI